MIIIDDFLSEEDCELIQREVEKQQYQLHVSDSSVRPEFHMMAAAHNKQDTMCKCLFAMIVFLPEVVGHELYRSYTNLAPPGEFFAGEMHQDDGEITALYYPHDWDTVWGGGTEFEDGTVVEYKRNRLLLFDSDIKHRSQAHTSPKGWRFTVAYKTGLSWA